MWRSIILIFLIMTVALFGIACEQTPIFDEATQGQENSETKKDYSIEGTIEIIGSTSVQPLAEELAEAFMLQNPQITVNVQGGGSSVGVKSALDGLGDIGNASRNLKESELGKGLVQHVAALDGIAVVVHPDNPVSDLSAAQVKKIYTGEIVNWREVGGVDSEIIVFNREAASGTRGAFIDLTGLEEKQDDGSKKLLVTGKALESNSNGALKTSISTKTNAIGYVSLGTIDGTIKAVSIDGMQPTTQNVIDGEYTLFRPFLMLTNGEPNAQTQLFLDFVMSELGQAIVSEKYISSK